MNNSGDLLQLFDDSANAIDVVNYSRDWYGNDAFDDGGFSLEQKNPNLPCTNAFNWSYSTDPVGGTPGLTNSIFNNAPDTKSPQLERTLVNSSFVVDLIFSESVNATAQALGNYTFSPTLTLGSATIIDADSTRVQLFFSAALDTGVIYTVTINNVNDCSGNGGSNLSGTFALPQQAQPGDVIINEILFDPFTGGSDFVEVYNRSDRVISLQNWTIANWEDGSASNFQTLTEEPLILFPETYYAFTRNPQFLIENYPTHASERLVEINGFPVYGNDSGTVYLFNNLQEQSDRFVYTDDLHFSILDDFEGISLERLAFNRPTNDPTNWHSAAESVGFATPGLSNSQQSELLEAMEQITVNPEVFSPDNDGQDDVLNIQYSLASTGYRCDITIYDAKGRLVRSLAQNEELFEVGAITWDGTRDNREKARTGIYIVYIELTDPNGQVKPFKRTAVLATRF